jgi:hypothetical protein
LFIKYSFCFVLFKVEATFGLFCFVQNIYFFVLFKVYSVLFKIYSLFFVLFKVEARFGLFCFVSNIFFFFCFVQSRCSNVVVSIYLVCVGTWLN